VTLRYADGAVLLEAEARANEGTAWRGADGCTLGPVEKRPEVRNADAESVLFDPPWAVYVLLLMSPAAWVTVYVLMVAIQLGPGAIPLVLGPLLAAVGAGTYLVRTAYGRSTRIAVLLGYAGAMIWGVSEVIQIIAAR
jgi:hypothetical protein